MHRKENYVHLDDKKIIGMFFHFFLFVRISKLYTMKKYNLLIGLKFLVHLIQL